MLANRSSCKTYNADGEIHNTADRYNPYLTMRRNFQHADDDFTNVMWLQKVCLFQLDFFYKL